MIRRRLLASATVLLLYALAQMPLAQAQSAAADTVYRLHGTVVNGISGKTIARAVVQSGDGRLATWTDSDGHFAIDVRVPAKAAEAPASPRLQFSRARFEQRIFVMARKPGYLPPEQPQFLLLDDTLSSTDVKLTLMPAAAMAGRVSAVGTDSASDVRLMLMMHQPDGGGRLLWVQAGATVTNTRGEFRFINLRPGEYIVVTTMWQGEDVPQAEPNVATQRYPPVFSGDQPSLASAQKFRLHAGDLARTELHLHLATYYPVTIPVASQGANTFINVRELEPDALGGSQLRYNQGKSAVEGLLPDGQYAFMLTSNGPQPAFAVTTLNVAGAPVRSAPVALAPGRAITVRVHTEFTRQENGQSLDYGRMNRESGANSVQSQQANPLLQVVLQPEGREAIWIPSSVRSGTPDQLMLENVPPGRYVVNVQPSRGYAASVTSAGIDLLRQPLVVNVSGTPGTIDVTLRDDTATLTGSVTAPSQPADGQSFVFLIPTDGAAQFVPIPLSADGRFGWGGLVPGSYRVLAVHGPRRQIAFRDPETMRHYEGKGTSITVSPGQQVHIDIPQIEDAAVEDN